jgi:hypothetical protein
VRGLLLRHRGLPRREQGRKVDFRLLKSIWSISFDVFMDFGAIKSYEHFLAFLWILVPSNLMKNFLAFLWILVPSNLMNIFWHIYAENFVKYNGRLLAFDNMLSNLRLGIRTYGAGN